MRYRYILVNVKGMRHKTGVAGRPHQGNVKQQKQQAPTTAGAPNTQTTAPHTTEDTNHDK